VSCPPNTLPLTIGWVPPRPRPRPKPPLLLFLPRFASEFDTVTAGAKPAGRGASRVEFGAAAVSAAGALPPLRFPLRRGAVFAPEVGGGSTLAMMGGREPAICCLLVFIGKIV